MIEFTAEDYARRMERAVREAEQAGLTGVLITPGRIRLLHGLSADGDHRASHAARLPAGAGPAAARPDPGAPGRRRGGWGGGDDGLGLDRRHEPVRRRGSAAGPERPLRHLRLGLGDARARSARAPPQSGYTSMTATLPMLRAVKDAHEIERLVVAGEAADASYPRHRQGQVRRAHRERGGRRPRRGADGTRPLPGRLHRRGSGPNGANPHHEAGDRTIQEGDMVVLDFGGTPGRLRLGHLPAPSTSANRPTRSARCSRLSCGAQQAGFEAVRPGSLPGDRPRRTQGDRRRRLRRVLHPPRRPRHRPDHARAAVHGRGRGRA